MHELNSTTSAVIRTGTVIGIVIMAIGLLLSGTDFGSRILLVGTVILVLTPMCGVATSTICLVEAGDRKWVAVALCLILVVVTGLAITVLF